MEVLPIVRRLIFPAPQPPAYEYDSFPDSTIWIPCPAPYSDIPCILIPYRGADSMIIFAHGNGCDIGSMYETMQYYKNHWKVNILLFEYPGYGSCGGVPSEESINFNMNRVYEFVRDVFKWPNDRLILFGQSIGTGPVCQLANRLNKENISLAGVILLSPYTCLKDVVQFLAGSIAKHLIATKFDNLECVHSITDPILIIHGVQDEIIPIEQGQKVYDACVSARKHLLVVNSATHNVFDHHLDIIQPVNQFITCYLRTEARVPSPEVLAATAKALQQAAEEEEKRKAAEARSSSSSSFSSSSSLSAKEKSPSPLPAPFFVHHPPSSPMPPATIKLERKYFSVPAAVIEAFERSLEEQRKDAESRAKSHERKQAVKGFFSSIGAGISSVGQIIVSSVSGGRKSITDERKSDSQGRSSAPPLPPRRHTEAAASSITSGSASKSSTQRSGSPQRSHSPARRESTYNVRSDLSDSTPSASPISSPSAAVAASSPSATSSSRNKRPIAEADTFMIEGAPRSELEHPDSVDV